MEGRIEYTYLRNRRQDSTYRPDTQDVCRIVKRRENRTLLKLCDHLISDKLAAYELFGSMNNPMADRLDIVKT